MISPKIYQLKKDETHHIFTISNKHTVIMKAKMNEGRRSGCTEMQTSNLGQAVIYYKRYGC